MQPDPVAALDGCIEHWVNAAASPRLTVADRERLAAMARSLLDRGMPEPFIVLGAAVVGLVVYSALHR